MSETTSRNRPEPKEPEHLSCEVCIREIPASTALSLEGPDYLVHFCGVECLDRWRRDKGVSEADEEHPENPHPHHH